jgi:hypothetical protein
MYPKPLESRARESVGVMRAKSVADLARAVDKRLKREGESSPGLRILRDILEVVYFASLKTEEGKPLQLRIALVNPRDPDPGKPPRPRADRWKIMPLAKQLPFTVPTLVKLSKAADPWSSSLAVYFDSEGIPFVWGLIDQTIHFNTMLFRETESGYAPPGLFQVVTTGTADLTIYREYGFVARLAQDNLLGTQSNVFWEGPVHDRLWIGIEKYLAAIFARQQNHHSPGWEDDWTGTLTEKWIGTLCRILLGIQRYRHGGALLLTRSNAELDIKYKINYSRLPKSLISRGIASIRMTRARQKIVEDYFDTRKIRMPITLYLDESIAESDGEDFQDEITGCVRFVSSLSCVDGLILASPDLSIRGFGVEIRTKNEVDSVYLAPRPKARASSLRRLDPNHYGTRHRSMMRYCAAHKNSVGFVVSQDGEIRAMTRVAGRLVMWENLQVHLLWDLDFRRQIPSRAKKSAGPTGRR